MRTADDAVEVEVENEGALEGNGSAKSGLTALGRLRCWHNDNFMSGYKNLKTNTLKYKIKSLTTKL